MQKLRKIDNNGECKRIPVHQKGPILVLSQIAMQKMSITTQKIEYLNAKNNFCIPNFNLGIYICYILFYNWYVVGKIANNFCLLKRHFVNNQFAFAPPQPAFGQIHRKENFL